MPPVNATIGCEQGKITPNAPYLPSRNNDAHRDPPLDLLALPSTRITAGTLERPHRGLSASTSHRNPRKQGSQHRSQPSQKRMGKTQCRLDRHSVGEKMAGDRTCGSVVIWIREPMAARSPPWRAHSNRSSNVRDAENGPGMFIRNVRK